MNERLETTARNNARTTPKIIIIGGGMVGLSIAHQLIERKISDQITIIEKTKNIGQHTSGRNSGVLHAGIYYKNNSLKARLCTRGAKRLKKWIIKNNLPLKECGKLIIAHNKSTDKQLDLLYDRGIKNGANVKFIERTELTQISNCANAINNRALWSPNTAVTSPLEVLKTIEKQLIEYGAELRKGETGWKVDPEKKMVYLTDGTEIGYDHIINCAGLHADEIANKFNLGDKYNMLPFKGIYWKINPESKIRVRTNIYPVPDLGVPFLGIHFTPSAVEPSTVYIGPTATPAWGRENYSGLENIEIRMSAINLATMAKQYINNKGGFRRYAHEQALLALKPLVTKEAQKLIPQIKSCDIVPCGKVGIRPQLYDIEEERLVDDFLCLYEKDSTHVLNAISPAFTASFELADHIIDGIKR